MAIDYGTVKTGIAVTDPLKIAAHGLDTVPTSKLMNFFEEYFFTENVETIVDFNKQTGDFTALERDLTTDLPYNNYETTLDKFHWEQYDKKDFGLNQLSKHPL